MNWPMNPADVIDLAANKVGGISELARRLRWHKGSIAAIKAGKKRGGKLPAHRAAQLAEIIGSDPMRVYLESLKNSALDDYERTLIAAIAKIVEDSRST